MWDEESQSIKTDYYDTTRFGGGGTAYADATPEVWEKVRAYEQVKMAEYWNEWNERQSHVPVEGRLVVSTGGRKFPKGMTGWVGVIERVPAWNSGLAAKGYTDTMITLDTEAETPKRRVYRVNARWLETLHPSDYLRPVSERSSMWMR